MVLSFHVHVSPLTTKLKLLKMKVIRLIVFLHLKQILAGTLILNPFILASPPITLPTTVLCIVVIFGLSSRNRSRKGQLICLLTLRLLKTTKIFSFLKKEIFLTMPSGITTNPKRSDRYFGNWANSTQIQYVTTCSLFTLRFMADLPLILSSLSVLSSACSD